MLAFLLDEHVNPNVALTLARLQPEVPVFALLDWQGGILIGQSDEEILSAANASGLTLVTYDKRTIPSVLVRWAASARPHSGVLWVDQRTIPPNDLPILARSLIEFWERHRQWTGRIGWPFCREADQLLPASP